MADNFRNLFGGGHIKHRSANPVKVARVESVVYGPYLADGVTRDPDYNDVTDIGKIRYVIITSAQTQDKSAYANPPARPFSAFMHQYPLNSEYVYILEGPGLGLNEKAGDIGYYYLGPIKLWGSPHHNAHPDMNTLSLYVNNNSVTYEQNQKGVNQDTSVKDMAFPLGQDFPEKSNIKSIMPFGGDIVLEGRHGNSIRFGSTTNKGVAKFNTWSDSIAKDPSQAGKPILILRNGQGIQSDKNGSTPTVENINVDDSSIYMTAGQDITITELPDFPLTSWNVILQRKVQVAISLTTPPTANTTLSAQQQDEATLPPPAPPPTPPTGSSTTGSSAPSEPPPAPPPPPEPPPPTDTRGTPRGEYTNNYNNKFELFSKKSGFSTTIYAYQKGTQNLIKTGMPSSTADINVLVREMQLSLADNDYYF